MGWVGVRLKREGIYVYLELIHCYRVETNTTLSSNYPPIKNEFKTQPKPQGKGLNLTRNRFPVSVFCVQCNIPRLGGNTSLGTSLVVQWLRLLDSNAGDVDLILGWGTRIPHARLVAKAKQNNAPIYSLAVLSSFTEPGPWCGQGWLLLVPIQTSVSLPLLDSGGSWHSLSPDLFLPSL